ncbi:MAG: hypothetical protein ACP5U2_00050 [Bryobacteraceae bacterium]
MKRLWIQSLSVLAFSLTVLGQSARLRPAPSVWMPAQVDSNSPVFWRDGQFHVFNSAGAPVLSWGVNQFAPVSSEAVRVDSDLHFPMWIEAAWVDDDGTVYAWYHYEQPRVCTGTDLVMPHIGALVSYDGGHSFQDLGLILTSPDPPDCSARNGFFAGGHGDFSVIVDRDRQFFYFLFGNYGGEASSQGIGLARMAFEDRKNPVGAVWKYFRGDWSEPGLGGRLTPIFPVATPWQQAHANAFWGPSIHWNSYLESYVVLLNHACCEPGWPAAGVYVSFNPDVSDPLGWSTPTKIMDRPPGYYPQVVGLLEGETDSLASHVARFYLHGISAWEIVFSRPDDNPEEEEPEPPVDDVVPPSSAPPR